MTPDLFLDLGLLTQDADADSVIGTSSLSGFQGTESEPNDADKSVDALLLA